jgi:hypothetical protein
VSSYPMPACGGALASFRVDDSLLGMNEYLCRNSILGWEDKSIMLKTPIEAEVSPSNVDKITFPNFTCHGS